MKKVIDAIKKFAKEKKKAFTLIELMGVLVIVGILTVILVPVINNTIKNKEQDLYNQQIELIKLSAKNLASDNEYILPEEVGEEIFITLGQLRAMGYAEETIINPLTKENFPNSMIVMVIKRELDYDYEIMDGGTVITSSGITVSVPSKKYIKEGAMSSYIITTKTDKKEGEHSTEYYVNLGKENIDILGEASKNSNIRYKIIGSNGLYKLIVVGGEKEGYLYFKFNGVKDIDGKEIEVSETNSDVESNKKIIVDNTAPTCNWSGENNSWTNNKVTIALTGKDNYKMNSSKASYTKEYSQSGVEIQKESLSYELEDEAGNKAMCRKSANVYYDTKAPTKPAITLKVNTKTGSDYNQGWTKDNVWTIVKSEDKGSGINEYYIGHDANADAYTYSGLTWTKSINNAKTEMSYLIDWGGSWPFYIKVCDKVGNCSTSDRFGLQIDKTPPICNWVENDTWTKDDVTVSVSGSDSDSGISSPSGKNWIYNSKGEEIDMATLSYTIYDKVGNKTECSKNVSVKHDTLAPRISGPHLDGCYPSKSGYEQIRFDITDALKSDLTYTYTYNSSANGCSGPVNAFRKEIVGSRIDGFRCLGAQIQFSNISVSDDVGNTATLPDTVWLNRTCSS